MLILDQEAINVLDAALIEDEWFISFEIPENKNGLRKVNIENNIYILSEKADESSGLLFVNTAIFESIAHPKYLFERVARVAFRYFDRGISIPVAWQPYYTGARLSIYAQSYAIESKRFRAYFEQSVKGGNNIYAFALSNDPIDQNNVDIDMESYHQAFNCYLDALIADSSASTQSVGDFGILLSEPLRAQFARSGSLSEWYDRKLNKEQLQFVDKKSDHPIRLRGAAGTGKTQAMAVKCLRELYEDKENKTFAFLTHSSALAHEIIREIFYGLDSSEKWSSLKVGSDNKKLWVGTLYELAQEKLNYLRKGLNPLAIDGHEGRELQKITINDALTKVLKEPSISLDLLKNCGDLEEKINDHEKKALFIEEVMNEFACILDAENIRKGTPEAEKYINSAREQWQMSLPTISHRKLVLEIYDAYCDILHEQKYMSLDQMIADFGRYLSTHEWSHLRNRDGFDVIFVDEYHYFTRPEAMLLHNLFKRRANHSDRWPLIMAYDLKQSTRDVALGGGIARFKNPGVGESTPVELTQVYRSTPQISKFLQDIDASFPAMDLEGEYNIYQFESKQQEGVSPILKIYETNDDLVKDIYSQASKMARELSKSGDRVAILCLNEEMFDIYVKAGKLAKEHISIVSREDFRQLRYARNKPIFSMPEYVAGLQFNSVFIIHADAVDFSMDSLSTGSQRRYISRLYLGASRAISKLMFSSSKERGGKSPIFDGSKNIEII